MPEKHLDLAAMTQKHRLSPEQIKTFHEMGWVTLNELFSEQDLTLARSAFDRMAEEAKIVKTTQDHRGARFVLSEKSGEIVINRIVWAGGAEPDLLTLSEDPRILIPVAQLLDSPEMDQLLSQAHYKLPGDGVSFAWHQDVQHRDKGPGTWKDINKTGSYVQTILLLDEMTEENGALQFIPGSSQWGRIFDAGYEYDTPLNEKQKPDAIDYSKAKTITGKAGSLVLFGPYTVHGSGANNSTQSRRILINGYAYPGANSRVYPGKGSGRRIKVDF
ncbi:phytanoyl-CoA dioxygenase family protein [bacterium]|nr:phytanoyl-CoA dioxygenase family protein [bacterium]